MHDPLNWPMAMLDFAQNHPDPTIIALVMIIALQLGCIIRILRRKTCQSTVETLFSSSQQYDPRRVLGRVNASIEDARFYQRRRDYTSRGLDPEQASELAADDLSGSHGSCLRGSNFQNDS
jgi:hypothetical protein